MSDDEKKTPPVKQEGLCIMPPPPTHYRMMPPQRAKAFHVTQQQPPVKSPPNQSDNQGPGIRIMAPTKPTTQASTPTNSDLKVSQMSQSMNLAFVQPVRATSQNYFGRPPPQSQPPKMPNHRIQGQQSVFPPQSTPFIQPMQPVQHLYCMSYYGRSGQRPMVPQYYPGQAFTAISDRQTPQQTQTYINYPQYLPLGPQPPVVASTPQNLQQVPPPPMTLTQNTQPQTGQKKRRAKAISIIDTETGKDKLDEIYISHDWNPPSGESSARQTPQPHYINKEVQNTFTKQVNMVINQEKMDEIEHSLSPSLDQHIDTQSVYQTLPPTQAVQFSNRNDLVQSSKLQLPTKDFIQVGQHTNTTKEVTPTLEVSANVVTAEVDINKQNRESPVKSRKPRELLITKEIKEPPVVLEKREEHKINKEEFKIKEPTSPPVVTSITLTSKDVKEANNQREENKTQKKDKMEQQKSPIPSPEIVPENICPQNSLRSAPVQENDQWSPFNMASKKIYDRDFLLALRNDPKSRKKPDNLPDIVAQEDRGRIGDIRDRYPMGGKPTDFKPSFSGSNYTGKVISVQRAGTLPKRNSQQGKNSGNSRGSKPSIVTDSTSVRGGVKLNETDKSDNAWNPDLFVSGANMSDNEKKTKPQIDELLYSSQMFGTWGRESNIKPPNIASSPMSANVYAALENIGNDIDKKSPMNYSSKDPYRPKGTSLETPNYKHTFEDGRGSISGSQHRSHDNSQRSKLLPTSQQNLPKSNPPEQSDQLQCKIKNILEGYLNDCYTVSERVRGDTCTSLLNTAFSQLVSESYICVLEISSTARLGSGTLFAHLIKRATLSVENYCTGLEEVLSQVDDLSLDIPKIWDYLAELIAPIIHENAVPLVRLHKSFEIIIEQGHASKLLDPLFKLVVIEKGPNYLHSLWQSSGLNLSDFMMSSQVNSFIQENELEFLLAGTNTVISQTELTYEQIHQKLLEFFENNNSLDDVFVWIKANIGERIKEKQFVRTLATAVFEDSIVKPQLKIQTLRKHYLLLICIVDSRMDYELECLYALQALMNKLDHPRGIVLSIFDALYDDSVFSRDSFLKWKTSDNPAEQNGKDIILKQLACFFIQLREDEEPLSEEDVY